MSENSFVAGARANAISRVSASGSPPQPASSASAASVATRGGVIPRQCRAPPPPLSSPASRRLPLRTAPRFGLHFRAVAGERVTINVSERTILGSAECRRLRRRGVIPGVLYGREAPVAIAIGERDLRHALTGKAGSHVVLDVTVDGAQSHAAILKEYQRDPVRGFVRHVDLQEVRLDVAIQAAVNIHLLGSEDAPGVKAGGVLSQPVTTINVEALPMEVPESIEADVSTMEIGDTLRLEDIPPVEGATFLDDPHETVIATITAPVAEAEPEPVEGEEGEGLEGVVPEGEDGEPAEGTAEGGEGGSGEAGSSDSEG